METRKRREINIARQREDSEDKEEGIKPKRIAVDPVDVQYTSTSEGDDEEQEVKGPVVVLEPTDLPAMSSWENTSDSKQEELIDSPVKKSETEKSEVSVEIKGWDAITNSEGEI